MVRNPGGLLWALQIVALLAVPANAIVIYQDDFSGNGLSSLNGTTPDVTPTGTETWASGQHLLNNGVQDGGGLFTALLPFTPQAGAGLYTFSADFSVAGSSWLAMGFANQLKASAATLDGRWLAGSTDSHPALWALMNPLNTTSGSASAQSFLGYANSPPGQTNGSANYTVTGGVNSLVLTIDTTNPDWLVTWDFNGDGVDRTATVLAANVPAIQYLGFSTNSANGTSHITSLKLEGPAPPNMWNVNGGGSFNIAANWHDNVVPTASAVFGSILTAPNAPATVTIDSPASVNSLSFQNANSYIVNGPSTLTLTGLARLEATQGTHTINAQIAGSAGLTKAGTGTLVLTNGSNSYTGDTNISGGILELTNLGAINQASGVTNVAAAATLRLNGDGNGNGAHGALSEPLAGAGILRLQGVDVNNPAAGGLTSEVITVSSANPGFQGQVSIGGGTLEVTNSGSLGSGDNTAATGTSVDGNTSQGALRLSNVTVSGERLALGGRAPDITAPHLSSTGNSGWTGDIVGDTAGNQYNIESQSGTLTISGNISFPDQDDRYLNLSGAGNGIIQGRIIDRTIKPSDGAEAANVNVMKTGSGTWTIATIPPPENSDPLNLSTARDGYHQGRTVVAGGTLAVQATGSSDGELWSRTIEVHQGAVFDASSFSTYSLQAIDDPDGTLGTGDETGQTLTGSGTVKVGGSLAAYDDSTLAPGDHVGTLTLNGNFSYSTFANTPAGSWDYELGKTTAAGASDRLVVNGAATISAAAASNAINVKITPVEGTLAAGAYLLVQANSLSVTGAAVPAPMSRMCSILGATILPPACARRWLSQTPAPASYST